METPTQPEDFKQSLVGVHIGVPSNDYTRPTNNAIDQVKFLRLFRLALRRGHTETIEMLLSLRGRFHSRVYINSDMLVWLLRRRMYDLIRRLHECDLISCDYIQYNTMKYILDARVDIVELLVAYIKERFKTPLDGVDQLYFYNLFILSIRDSTDRQLINKIKPLFDNVYLSAKFEYISPIQRLTNYHVDMLFDDLDAGLIFDTRYKCGILSLVDDYSTKLHMMVELTGLYTRDRYVTEVHLNAIQRMILRYPDMIFPVFVVLVRNFNEYHSEMFVSIVLLLMRNCNYTETSLGFLMLMRPRIFDFICADGHSHMVTNIDGIIDDYLFYSVNNYIPTSEQKKTIEDIFAICSRYDIAVPVDKLPIDNEAMG